jgi:hypothetical protein
MKAVRSFLLIALHMGLGAFIGIALSPLVAVVVMPFMRKADPRGECGNGIVLGIPGFCAILGIVAFGILGCMAVDKLDAKSSTRPPGT